MIRAQSRPEAAPTAVVEFSHRVGPRVGVDLAKIGRHLVILLMLLSGCGPGVPPDQLPPLPAVPTGSALPAVAQQLDTLRHAVEEKPGNAKRAGRLGMAYLVYQLDEAGETAFRRARLLQPRNFDWLYYHAEALTRLGRFSEAVPLLKTAVSIKGGHVMARGRLGLLHMQLGDLAAARTRLQTALDKEPDNAWIRLGLARVYLRADEPEKARLHLDRLVETVGHAGNVYFALSDVARRTGDTQKAEQYLALFDKYRAVNVPVNDPLMRAVQQMDLSGRSLLPIAGRFAQMGETEKAIQLLLRALEYNPGSQMTHTALITAYAETRQFDLVDRYYGLALESGPVTAPLLRALGRARVREERLAEAKETLEQALELDPNDAGTLAWLGVVQLKQRNTEQGLRLFTEAVEKDPRQRLARHNLANILLSQRRHEQALIHLQHLVLVEDRHSPRVWRQIGESYLQLGNKEAAREALTTAVASAERFDDSAEKTRSKRLLQALGQ